MNSIEFNKILLRNFKLEPTNDQSLAIESLSDFLFNKTKVSVFLLKGYAGTGKLH